MEERRYFEQGAGRKRMDPVEDGEGIAFHLAVVESEGTVIAGRGFIVVGIRVDGDLKEVLASLGIEPQLIFRCLVADEREKCALRVGRIVVDGGDGRFEAVIGARSSEAC